MLFLLNFMECIVIHCADPVDLRILATRRDSMYRIHILKCPEVGLFVLGATAPQWARASSFTRFLDHTQQHTSVGRTSQDEWSTCRRDLSTRQHTTLNNKHNIHAPDGEPTISDGERPQTYALDSSATGTGPDISGHSMLLSSVMLQLELVPLRV